MKCENWNSCEARRRFDGCGCDSDDDIMNSCYKPDLTHEYFIRVDLGSHRRIKENSTIIARLGTQEKEIERLRARVAELESELESWGVVSKCDKCGESGLFRRDINYPNGGDDVYYCPVCWDERLHAKIAELERVDALHALQKVHINEQ